LCEPTRQSDPEYGLPCNLPGHVVVQLVWKFEAVGRRVELRVVVEVAIRMAANITESFQVLVRLFAVTEGEQIEGYLAMGKFNTRIFEECISRLKQVHSLSPSLWRLSGSLLQFWMSQNHLRNLEKHHLTANLLDNTVGWLQSCDKAWLDLVRFYEIVRQVIKEVNDKFITIGQVDKQVLRLWKEEVLGIRHNHHLWLLERRFEVVELHVVVVCQERDLNPLAGLAWQQLLLQHALYRWAGVAQIAGFDCWLRNIKCKNVSGWHGRPVHVLVISNEVNCTAVELGPLIMVSSVAIFLDRWVVIIFCPINISAEWTDPLRAILEPPHKWIDIRPTVLTPNYCLALEVDLWYLWYFAILTLNKNTIRSSLQRFVLK